MCRNKNTFLVTAVIREREITSEKEGAAARRAGTFPE